jgi:hypothetical protein
MSSERCGSYTLTGSHCDLPEGHDGRHGHTYETRRVEWVDYSLDQGRDPVKYETQCLAKHKLKRAWVCYEPKNHLGDHSYAGSIWGMRDTA